MTNQQYTDATAVTETIDYDAVGQRLTKHARVLHHAMGLVTEAGEIMDALKKAAIYGKELDTVNVLEELGDIQWYVFRLIATLNEDFDMNTSMEQIMEVNIAKLRKRYGEKFTENKASVRDLDAEREILERLNKILERLNKIPNVPGLKEEPIFDGARVTTMPAAMTKAEAEEWEKRGH